MDYYEIPTWQDYQHYKDRDPPWIKLHFTILTSPTWVMLDDASRVLAIACMLIASRNHGRVPANPEYLKRVAYLSKTPNFKPLIECGFLANASCCKQMLADARPETETETEKRRVEVAFSAFDYLLSQGVDGQVITDWLKLRKKKKAEVTLTAIQGIESEASKAFMTLEDALRLCCQNGWQGFNANWLKGQNGAYKSRLDKLAETGAALGGYSAERFIDGTAVEIDRTNVPAVPNLLWNGV